MENRRVVNQYGVLFALYIAKESNKNLAEIIDLMNKIENDK